MDYSIYGKVCTFTFNYNVYIRYSGFRLIEVGCKVSDCETVSRNGSLIHRLSSCFSFQVDFYNVE